MVRENQENHYDLMMMMMMASSISIEYSFLVVVSTLQSLMINNFS